jgi:uncharacterized membrane protein YbaN (DUF454 family)
MNKNIEISLGIVLVVLGCIGGLLPLIPGSLLGIPGILLLAKHFKWIRRWLKKRKMLRKI